MCAGAALSHRWPLVPWRMCVLVGSVRREAPTRQMPRADGAACAWRLVSLALLACLGGLRLGVSWLVACRLRSSLFGPSRSLFVAGGVGGCPVASLAGWPPFRIETTRVGRRVGGRVGRRVCG